MFGLHCIASTVVAAEFVVSQTGDGGPGSLRQAILDANGHLGADRIVFNIPAPGVQRIDVGSNPLPVITDSVTIDGYTQPRAAANTLAVGNDAVILIEIRRTHSASETDRENYDGLVLNASNCTVRGLSLTGFLRGGGYKQVALGVGIFAGGGGGHVMEGNFIGVPPDGFSTTEAGQSLSNLFGIRSESPNNRIGGTSPAARNVISGNRIEGILVRGAGTVIQGNYIGTDASGSRAVRNLSGVQLFVGVNVTGCLIGGTAAGAGNVISGNAIAGVQMGNASGVTIQGNFIGTSATGLDPVPNAKGIEMFGSSQNLVGGLDANAGNLIAFNVSNGISIRESGTGNRILSNRIFANDDVSRDRPPRASRQIALKPINDLNDLDGGPNNGQNFPIITRQTSDPDAAPGTTKGTLEGGLNSTPSTRFTLQFFYLGDDCELLGTSEVETDRAGNVLFAFPFSSPRQLAGGYFTAIATDQSGNSSEFFPENGGVVLANISSRAFVGTSENIPIAGFIVRSPVDKRVLIRALGPSLNFSGVLADPKLQVFDANQTLVAENDDWMLSGQETEIRFTGLAPGHERDAALIVRLPAGNYTAQLRGADGGTGIGLIEMYDVSDPIATVSRLANISTRASVGKADDVLIAGVIASGNAAQRLAVRAIGPDLSTRGVRDALQDPTLELYDAAGTLLAFNDNWRDDQAQEIEDAQLAPEDTRDAVIVATVIPSNYTAVVRGKAVTTGTALVEVYDLSN